METLQIIDGVIDKINKVENEKQSEKAFTLAYWHIRGLADFLRIMLVYGNVKYDSKTYKEGDEYGKDKFSLDLDFPNLPYLIDNKTGVKITESSAIGKYLASKLNLADNGSYKEHMIEGVVGGMYISYTNRFS